MASEGGCSAESEREVQQGGHTLAKRPQSSCSSSATETEREQEGESEEIREKVTHWG